MSGYDLDDCPDLAQYAGDYNPGHNGRDLGADLLNVVKGGLDAHPRSQQEEVGPSELGAPCNRQLAYKFAGVPTVGLQAPKWAAAVGTAIHDHFADWLHHWNETHGFRYLSETRVWVGDLYPGRPITGHMDAFDTWTGTVIDLKGLALDTPIPTPDGWSTMARLQVGNRVFGADGQPCQVVGKSPVHDDRPCYRVTFDDESSVVTDNIHQWRFMIGDRNHREAILSTEEASQQVRHPVSGQRHLRVINPEALDLPDVDLPVHPYVLGCWLGDGDRTGGRICKPDDELFEHIRSCGYEVGAPDARGVVRTVFGLVSQLRRAGMVWTKPKGEGRGHSPTAGYKFVPDAYLRAGTQQRLALLQGFMDTDGTWNRKRNQAVFNSTDKGLAAAVAELVRSLGWKARIFEHQASGFGKTVTAYSVPFVPYGVNPFRLSRKADLVRMTGSSQARRRVVQSIESVPIVATQCIQVDNADEMFLCGEDMVPTHNCPSKSVLDKARRAPDNGATYDSQLDLYGQGAINAGLPVRQVGILRLPRNGQLAEADWKVRPHNPERAQHALRRAGAIAQLVDTLGPQAIALQPATEHYCGTCEWYRPGSTDLTTGCPGADTFLAARNTPPAALTDLAGTQTPAAAAPPAINALAGT